MTLAHAFFSGSSDDAKNSPTESVPFSLLQTVTPLKREEYLGLLRSKPVGEWQMMTQFLVSHHLLLLPSESIFDPGRIPFLKQKEDVAKANRIASQEANHAAALKRKAAKKVAHEALMASQQKSAAARKAARESAQNERQSKIKDRVAAAPTAVLTDIKKGADVKRWLAARQLDMRTTAQDPVAFQANVARLPPVYYSRQKARKIRPVIQASEAQGHKLNEHDKVLFFSWQQAILEAERQLAELFFEGQAGWREVPPRVKRKEREQSRAGPAGPTT